MRLLPLLLMIGAASIGASWLLGATPARARAAPTTDTPAQQPAASAADADDEAQEAEEEEEEGRDPAEIRRELAAAQRERDLMLARHAIAEFEHATRVREARFTLEQARAEQDAFETHRQRVEIASSALDLARMRDDARDAEEEMQQLAQMYGENELADRTATIVLQRAQRALDRAREELRITEEEQRHRLAVALPREQIELHQAVQSAESDLRLADLEGEALRLEQQHELAEQDATLEELRDELAEALAGAEDK